MIEGEGKLINQKLKQKYNRYYIYIPNDIVGDSAFPFQENDKLKIIIKDKKLIVEKG